MCTLGPIVLFPVLRGDSSNRRSQGGPALVPLHSSTLFLLTRFPSHPLAMRARRRRDGRGEEIAGHADDVSYRVPLSLSFFFLHLGFVIEMVTLILRLILPPWIVVAAYPFQWAKVQLMV